jgi:hypothetical protein
VLLELLDEPVVSSRSRQSPRGIKRKMSNWPLRKRGSKTGTKLAFEIAIVREARPQGARTRR